jgi:hypothetical protein
LYRSAHESHLMQVSQNGGKSVYMSTEDAMRHSGLVRRKAIASNKAAEEDDSKEPANAGSTKKGAGGWVNGVKKVTLTPDPT